MLLLLLQQNNLLAFSNLAATAASAMPVVLGENFTAPGVNAFHFASLTASPAVIKQTPGKVYGWSFYNAGAAASFLKFFDKSTAPTVGTDSPSVTLPMGAAGANTVSFPNGIQFNAGIAIAATLNGTDSDSTNPSGTTTGTLFYR